MSSMRLLERAFAIADSGKAQHTAEIRAALIREGFTYAECNVLTGTALNSQLREKIRAARISPDNSNS